MELPGFLYGFYERQPAALPGPGADPAATSASWSTATGAGPGSSTPPRGQGHQAGADKIHEFLGWCQELGIKVVTLYMLSTDNMNRSGEELDLLMGIIANTLDRLDEDANISVHAMGAPELLPDYLAERLNNLTARTPAQREAARQCRRRLRRTAGDRRRRPGTAARRRRPGRGHRKTGR